MSRWTHKQLEAIDDRGHNLLVAAAAGSGKTAVLVERIIQLVRQDRIDIDRLLIVTFTQAAAGEMRARISTRLQGAMQEEGEDQEFLRQQINLLNRASISTLHSFCLDVVRRYFHIIDISPSFRVGDATETALLKLEVLEELFEAEYQRGEAEFLRLVEMYAGGRDDSPLRELVLRTYEFIQSQPDPLAWLGRKVEEFNLADDQFGQSPWVKSLLQQIEIELAGVEEMLDSALGLTARPGGPYTYREALADDLLMVRQLRTALDQGIYEFCQQLCQVEHQRLAAARKDVDPVLKEEVQDLRDQGKKVIKDLGSKILFMAPAAFCQDLRDMYPGMICLAGLVEQFHHRYRESKTDRGLADFNDLEHYALEILADPLTAAEYGRQFEYIFVDEYQDSNLVQETILNRIRREDNLFLVGDVKQSIYRFRLADPSLFMAKYGAYHRSQGGCDRRIDLSANFRSRQTIIDAVNDVFSRIMTRQLGELDYQPEVFLEYGLQIPADLDEELDTRQLELLLIDKQGTGAGEEIEGPTEGEEAGSAVEELDEEPGDVEFEALMVAARIKELHGQVFYDSKNQCMRPLEYRDMVVLMRATRGQADVYYETLMGAGIPVYADMDRGYFETAEVKVFINLLHLIDNKRQDIPLLSVMRSPIGRFAVEELIEIRAGSSAATFHEALAEYVSSRTDTVAEKAAAFIERLHSWKEMARFLPMDELIWELLLETGYLHYAAAMPGGQQRQANLMILLERARQYQATSMHGLFHFLKFIEKLESSSSDMGMAKILGESEDVVRILSIHKSKGLEFPVVIVAGLGRRFNLSDTRAQVLFHKDLGIGPKYVDPDLRVTRDTIARAAMASRIRAENLAEEMRILYVALTRPRDKVILVGTVGDLVKSIKRWSKGTSPFHLARARGLLDWLGAVVVEHSDGETLRSYDPYAVFTADEDDSSGRPDEQGAGVIVNGDDQTLRKHDEGVVSAADVAVSGELQDGQSVAAMAPLSDQAMRQTNAGIVPVTGRADSTTLQEEQGTAAIICSDRDTLYQGGPSAIVPAGTDASGYRWLVKIIDRSRTGMAQAAAQAQSGFEERLQAASVEGSERREHVWSCLDWQYPYAAAINIPSKLSVSQVNDLVSVPKLSREGPQDSDQQQSMPIPEPFNAGYQPEAVPVFREPRFMTEAAGRGQATLSGAARGTILHKVMQLLDYKEVSSQEEIEGQIARMVEREILRAEEAAIVDRSKILSFFQSQLGQRVLAADRAEREVPFNLLYDAAHVFPDLPLGSEQLLLQGVIDLYFREEDGLVLIDYKSDRVTPFNKQALISGYRGQLQLYKTALEMILEQTVKACYLYLFDSDEAVLM